MTSRKLLFPVLAIFLCALFSGAPPASADSSHARIIRLSLVQGDVRFTRDSRGDPLTNSKATWETAELNLPIRQGYVVATDNGRAEVEFENGAMAFLNANTVLEFYDLSLDSGARTTRLVLRQGSASFYVNPARGDYFSVTGDDFTVEASGRSSFRLDNYDDGSTVETLKGHVSVLHKDNTRQLEKGQSLSMKAGDDSSLSVGRLLDEDDFDRWVSGRIDSVTTATNAAMQYTNSPYYSSGFADLYTYGSWFPVGGFGYGWRPYGVGYGWCPFDNGGWYFDPVFGWTFVGYQPWGWAPYHFGSWIFEPGFGWAWIPGGFGFGGFNSWVPVTGRFVRGRGGLIGVVPVHPLDVRSRTPLNLTQGVFPVSGSRVSQPLRGTSAADWKTLKSPPRETLTSNLLAVTPPARVSRTILSGNAGSRAVTMSHDSSIAYDPREHRFVNTNAPPASPSPANSTAAHSEIRQAGEVAGARAGNAPVANVRAGDAPVANARAGIAPVAPTAPAATAAPSSARTPAAPSAPRTTTPPARPHSVTPPPAPHYSGGERGGSRGDAGAVSRGGTTSSGGSGRASSAPAPAPAPAPRASSGSSGRPH